MEYKILLVSALLSALVISVQSRKINLLDKDDMDPEFWTEISCSFMQNSEEYKDAVCPIKRQEVPETLLNDVSGFWGPCSKPTCTIVYYGGSLPAPQDVAIEAFVGGTGEVKVEGRRSPIGSTIFPVGEIQASGDDILMVPITFPAQGHYVINITVSVTEDPASFALIDKIIIDLGDDVPEPITTTPKPPLTLYTIDTKEDLKGLEEFTEISCNYQDHTDEFWTWGCPQDVEDNGGFGYWTACHTSQCNFIFTSGKTRPKVKRIRLDGMFKTGGIISLSKKNQGFGSVYSTVASSEMINDETFKQFNLDQDCDNEFYNISISAVNGTMIIDKMAIELFDEFSDECSPDEKPVTEKPGVSPPTTPGGVAGITASLLLLSTAAFYAVAAAINNV